MQFDVYIFTDRCTIIKIGSIEYIDQYIAANGGNEDDAFEAVMRANDEKATVSSYTKIAAGYVLDIYMTEWLISKQPTMVIHD
jgi:hypothetical protein